MEVTRAQVVRALLAGACSVDGLLGMPVDRLRHEQVQWAADAGVLTTEDRAALCAALASSGVMVLAPHAAEWSGSGDGSGYGSGSGYGYGYGYGDGDGDGDGETWPQVVALLDEPTTREVSGE